MTTGCVPEQAAGRTLSQRRANGIQEGLQIFLPVVYVRGHADCGSPKRHRDGAGLQCRAQERWIDPIRKAQAEQVASAPLLVFDCETKANGICEGTARDSTAVFLDRLR